MEKQEVHALGVVQRDVEESQKREEHGWHCLSGADFWNGARWGLWLACSEFLFAWLQCWVAANLLFLVLDEKQGLHFTVLVWSFSMARPDTSPFQTVWVILLLNVGKVLLKPAGVLWMGQQITCPLLVFGKMQELYTWLVLVFSINEITARAWAFKSLNQS